MDDVDPRTAKLALRAFIILGAVGLVGVETIFYFHHPRRSVEIDLPVGMKIVGIRRDHGQINYNMRRRYSFEPAEKYVVNHDGDTSLNGGKDEGTYSFGSCILPDKHEDLILREH